MKSSSPVIAVALLLALAASATPSEPSRPYLETRHGVRQFMVDGKPFLILGGELRNSSSSSRDYMRRVWPQIVEKKFNTVVGAVTWELIKPEEGKLDFTSGLSGSSLAKTPNPGRHSRRQTT